MTLKTYMNSCSNYYTQCAFVQPDGSVIVNSGEIGFREEELLKIFVMFTSTNTPIGTTIEMNGEKYLILNHTKNRIIAKRYNCGIVAVRCQKLFIVAYHNESIETGVCVNAITKLGEILEDNGF